MIQRGCLAVRWPWKVKCAIVTNTCPCCACLQVGKTGSLLQDQQTSILQLSPITFQNAVEKDNQWRGAVTNQDDEHVAAIVNSKNDHRVYIWDQRWGKLVKILEGE